MYFSTALCISRDSRSMYCLIPSKLFLDLLSPYSKHPDFSLQMHIFPKQTAAHVVCEQSHLDFSLKYCKIRKWRSIPFNSLPSKASSKASHSCMMSSIPLFFFSSFALWSSLTFEPDKFKYKSLERRWKTVSCSQNNCLDNFSGMVVVGTSLLVCPLGQIFCSYKLIVFLADLLQPKIWP